LYTHPSPYTISRPAHASPPVHLTGTKLACGEGGCGACTVMISRWDRRADSPLHLAVNACLAPLCSVHGTSVTTIEGIGRSGALHAVQERLARAHGSQCGFCTPGVLMSAYSLLRERPHPTDAELTASLQGNLCRCTGYRPILDGLRSLCCGGGGDSSGCCGGGRGSSGCCMDAKGSGVATELFDTADLLPYDPSQEPLFPSELQLTDRYDASELRFTSDRVTWHRPVSLERLLQLKSEHPEAKLVVGNSEIGIEAKQKGAIYPHLICTSGVPELTRHSLVFVIGASVSLTRLAQLCRRLCSDAKAGGLSLEHQKRGCRALLDMLDQFAGPQIRNVAAIGGNVMTASPISDLIPLLGALGATLTLASLRGERNVAADQSFFVGYRRTAARPDEVLRSVSIPFCSERQHCYAVKQARRKEDDIAIVNAAIWVDLGPGGDQVAAARLCFGGLAPTVLSAGQAAAAMVGRRWEDGDALEAGLRQLKTEAAVAWGAPGGQAAYRSTLAASMLFRFYQRVCRDVGLPFDESAVDELDRRPLSATQVFESVPADQPIEDLVGRPVSHASAIAQVTGEAMYTDDAQAAAGELFLAPVMSDRARATVVGIDFTDALAMDGVAGFVDSRDVPGSNLYGYAFDDEPVFASSDVMFTGQFLAGVLAADRDTARRAARLVRVQYGPAAGSPVVTISDAAASDSFFPEEHWKQLTVGDVDEAFATAEHCVEGEMNVGGQEHFYFEPFSVLVEPKDGGSELLVYATSQNPSGMQSDLSKVTGLARNRIVVKVKRIGGGFGGKETRPSQLATPAAVAALKFGRPVRAVLDRWDDMAVSGGRHPVKARYKLAADRDGRLIGLRLLILLNAGCTLDMSENVAGRMLRACMETYRLASLSIEIRLCRTNLASNTAFRAFGTPQACAIMETAVSHLAESMGLSQCQIRELNLFRSGEITPNGAPVKSDNLWRCWQECLAASDYHGRLRELEVFNRASRHKKRGLSLCPIAYGIGMGKKFPLQSGATVNIYLDGSVLICHGGVEMGQGVHTKLLQVAARALQLPIGRLYIAETSTDKVPNTTASAASITTDINAPAVLDACLQLRRRLAPFVEANPTAAWEDWVGAAYLAGVSLSACGFCFNPPKEDADRRSGRGDSALYFTYGAACSEVEIDALTGDHVIRRCDIVMDLGASLNPAVDIGQVEGAFTQGCGLYTIEDLRYSPDGRLLTRGPGAYKIPGFSDIPEKLNIRLLRGSRCEHPKAVHSSKAVGEPPLNLAASVLTAIRQAVLAARLDSQVELPNGHQGQLSFQLDSPATSERIRLACGGGLVAEVSNTDGSAPWEVRPSD
uniref:FAD-binding PCMH-type domain-containing protein n=1 Tax=Macrostomum lignano TaxID=282301 RepID=A0A1I8GP54_9PLAT